MNDALISAGAVALLLAALVSADDRVREYVVNAARGTVPGNAADAGTRLGDLGSIVLTAARDQSLAYAPLTIFAVVAVILLVLMVRTF
jgi:hypothetical protein